LGLMLFQNAPDFVAEVTVDFKHESSNPAFSIFSRIGEHLFGKRINASTGLTASHGSEDGDPGKKASLGHNQPLRGSGRLRTLGMMGLADDQIEFASHCWRNVPR
jgi:hypothetical protein